MPTTLARDAALTALDFETTGHTRGQRSLPWQLGLAIGEKGLITETRSLLLRVPADFRFNPYAPGRWAEIRDELAQAPTLLESWTEIGPLLQNRWLVSHNAPVERGILLNAFPLHSFPQWIDTLRVARAVYPRMENYALEALIPALGLTSAVEAACPGLSPHDALYDAVGCLTLLNHILTLEGWADVSAEYLAGI